MWRDIALLILVVAVGHGVARLCGSERFGENNPRDKDDRIDNNIDFGYMMSDSDYVVDCCGIVSNWEAMFDEVSGTRTIYFQIWRPTTGTTYELVGQNSFDVIVDGEQTKAIIQEDRITVKSGDKWGWWSSGADIITYKRGNGEEDNNFMATLTAKSVGDTNDWGSTNVDDRSYAMRMDVLRNNDPTITNLPDTVSISTGIQSGSSIFDVSVSDDDSDDISSLTLSMTAHSDYSFDPSNYILSTAVSFEGTASHVDKLKFVVEDQCSNSVTATLTVSIVNQPLTIDNLPDSGSILEEVTAETLLFTVTSTDPDGTIPTCSLASSVPASSQFIVRPSGSDHGIYSASNPGFNYSIATQYVLTIECTDVEFTDSGTFTVLIIENASPVFLNLQNSTTVSTTYPIGTTAFTVLVFDTDTLTFEMTSEPTPCPFSIFNSGAIQITEDLSGHTTVGYDLTIRVFDGRNTVEPGILTITIADINDPVSISNLPISLSILENSAIGTTLYTVAYSDQDTTQAHTFSMTATSGSGSSYFTIIPLTGEVTTIAALNYEAMVTTTLVFDVTVSDPVTSDTKSLTIDVTNENENPSFGQSSYSISTTEGTAGTVIGSPTFGISDPDSGDTVTLANDCGTATGYFLMDSTTGQVSYQSDYDLDTTSLPGTVTCTVTATDGGGLTDTASLIITIADENDNTPIFSPASYSFHVSYHASAGTEVGTITATDADSGSYGTITYTLDQSSLAVQHFAISSSGLITVQATPYGSAMGFSTSVTITASAADVGAQTDTAPIVIIISDTTTTSTTTTTDRFVTFGEDWRNILWMTFLVIILFISMCVTTYIVFTCHGQNGCTQFIRSLRKPRQLKLSHHRMKNHQMRNRRDSDYSNTIEDRRPKHHRSRVSTLQARQAPPPVEFQHWRGQR